MTRESYQGTCDQCGRTFRYYLIHNGFNESCYAYCAKCGMTAVLDTHYKDRTSEGFPRHRAITAGAQKALAPCACGGSFTPGAAPRCPHCSQVLSAKAATSWIERNAPGAQSWLGWLGWHWQRNWDGLYALVIEDRMISNPWRADASGPAA